MKWEDGRLVLEVDCVIRIPVILEAIGRLDMNHPGVELTNGERETLDGVMHQLSNKEIADLLNVSESAIKHRMKGLLRKLQVDSRIQIQRLFGTPS